MRKLLAMHAATTALVTETRQRQSETFYRMEFKTQLDVMTTTAHASQGTAHDTRLARGLDIVRMCMEALTRAVDMGGDAPTPEQLAFFTACLRAQCRNIFGDSLMMALDALARLYGFEDFDQYIIIEMARRRGKSKGIGMVNGIFMCILPLYHAIIVNLDAGVAEQGIGYARDVVERLVDDPDGVFPVEIVRCTVDTLEVRSIWGTINTLYSSPNIERTGGTVRSFSLFFFLSFRPHSIFFQRERERDACQSRRYVCKRGIFLDTRGCPPLFFPATFFNRQHAAWCHRRWRILGRRGTIRRCTCVCARDCRTDTDRPAAGA